MENYGGSRRTTMKLEPISEREGWGFIVPPREDGRPAFAGCFDIDYVCGHCERALCTGARCGAFKALVFRCGGCGALNRVPAQPGVPCTP
jgi:Mu-like prophage protein Com